MEDARQATERLRDLVLLYEDQRSINQGKSLTSLESYLQRQVSNLSGADRYATGLLRWRHRKTPDHTPGQVRHPPELVSTMDPQPAL